MIKLHNEYNEYLLYMLFIYLPKCESSDEENFGEEAAKTILGEYL